MRFHQFVMSGYTILEWTNQTNRVSASEELTIVCQCILVIGETQGLGARAHKDHISPLGLLPIHKDKDINEFFFFDRRTNHQVGKN